MGNVVFDAWHSKHAGGAATKVNEASRFASSKPERSKRYRARHHKEAKPGGFAYAEVQRRFLRHDAPFFAFSTPQVAGAQKPLYKRSLKALVRLCIGYESTRYCNPSI